VGNGTAKYKIKNRSACGEKHFEPVRVLHAVRVICAAKLRNVYASGLADGVNKNNVNKVDMVGYVYGSHSRIPQAGNHEVVDQRDHAHYELLEHDRQGNCQGFAVKRQRSET